MAIQRGEIYFVSLDPAMGREAGGGKRRPVVVLSINDINVKPLVVTIIPGTSAKSLPRAFRNIVRVEPTSTNGLSRTTLFECHQIRAIDHGRFADPPIGVLGVAEMEQVADAVKYNLGLF